MCADEGSMRMLADASETTKCMWRALLLYSDKHPAAAAELSDFQQLTRALQRLNSNVPHLTDEIQVQIIQMAVNSSA
eukprot:6193756-Pleurochrysis_carterae.AAC.2